MQNYEALKSVFGYDNIKKELMLIRSWFLDDELTENKKIQLPRGIVFHGSMGCGKTLLMREYSKSFDCKVFVLEGKSGNISEEIHNVFEEARKEKKAIIVIDEIDLLVENDDRAERTLQQELDGMKDNGHILVLAATNSPFINGNPLYRNGRFDRKIYIAKPDFDSRIDIFNKFLLDLEVDTKGIDLKYIAQITGSLSGSDIKAIINDTYIRCKNDITTEDLEESFDRIELESWADEPVKNRDYRVAIHEAGHALMSLRYPQFFSFHLAKFTNEGGITRFYDVKELKPTLEYRLASFTIGTAGYLAEEIIFGAKGIGSANDMCKVREGVERLIQLSGIEDSADTIACWNNNDDRVESERKRAKNEKKVKRLIKKIEKDAKRYLKSNKTKLKAIANVMMEKDVVTFKDVAARQSV